MDEPRKEESDVEERRRFEDFFRTHYERVLQYVGRRTPISRVDDVVAATFIVAWRKFVSIEAPSLPWLIRIASFEVKSADRAARRFERSYSTDLFENIAGLSPDVFDGSELLAALSRLSASDQELLRLIHWDELTRTEAAEVLGASINAVNVRYHRALSRLECQMAPITTDQSRKGAIE